MSTQDFDVAVVGAGIGGLTAAGLLARAGRSVILLDRAPRAGGVCQSLERGGHHFELGATLLTGFGPGGPLATLCERLGVRLPLKECDPAFQVALPHHRISLWAEPNAWWREVRREFPEEEERWRALWSELKSLGEERDRVLQELSPLPPEGWAERLRVWKASKFGTGSYRSAEAGGLLKRAVAMPFSEAMACHDLSQVSRRVLEAALWYLSLRNAEECSTLEAAIAFQEVRHGTVTIPGGVAALVDALLEQYRQDGGQLRLEAAVDRLILEGGRITGLVTTSGETIGARWLVADVPPDVLTGTLLPPTRGWLRRRRELDGPWTPAHTMQGLVLAIPESLLPSELSGHCFVVPDPSRPAREENLIFVRAAPAWDGEQRSGKLRCLTVGRFVASRLLRDDESVRADLLEAVDQVIPGVSSGLVFDEVLPPAVLGEMWGRPSAAVRYTLDPCGWLGQRGLPHRVGWPGLLVVGEWTYPGRLVSHVVEGAMRVAELISENP